MNWKYQLVLQFPLSDPTDFDTMIVLEDTLIRELGNKASVDGHDAGSGQMNIFIHTNDPKHIFESLLLSHGSDRLFSQAKAGYRGFGTENFTALWPNEFKGIFRTT
jgi:hypothetical protein